MRFRDTNQLNVGMLRKQLQREQPESSAAHHPNANFAFFHCMSSMKSQHWREQWLFPMGPMTQKMGSMGAMGLMGRTSSFPITPISPITPITPINLRLFLEHHPNNSLPHCIIANSVIQ